MRILEEYYVQFIDDYITKQYLLAIVEEAGTFGVVAFYGRIGTPTLQVNWKARGVSEAAAHAAFARSRNEKVRHGYKPAARPLLLDPVALIASHGRV